MGTVSVSSGSTGATGFSAPIGFGSTTTGFGSSVTAVLGAGSTEPDSACFRYGSIGTPAFSIGMG